MRLSVSTKQVAMMVRLPPSSTFLAAPKKRLGGKIAAGSTPPDMVRPLVGTARL